MTAAYVVVVIFVFLLLLPLETKVDLLLSSCRRRVDCTMNPCNAWGRSETQNSNNKYKDNRIERSSQYSIHSIVIENDMIDSFNEGDAK